MSKLFRFDFTVEYHPELLNTVADALSRREEGEPATALALSTPTFAIFDDLCHEIVASTDLSALRTRILAGELGEPWACVDDLILHDHRVHVQPSSPSLQSILDQAHNSHECVQKTLHRLRRDFHISGDHRLVQDLVQACAVCQCNQTETMRPAGLLQPLQVPSSVWADIAVDFIEGFPRVHGKSIILTVVDRFSKYAHFIPLSHPYTANSIARAFFEGIVRLHGLPKSIVSDRDPVFTSNFWRNLFRISGVHLHMSFAFHS